MVTSWFSSLYHSQIIVNYLQIIINFVRNLLPVFTVNQVLLPHFQQALSLNKLLDSTLKVLEANNEDRYVVKGLISSGLLEH